MGVEENNAQDGEMGFSFYLGFDWNRKMEM